MPRKTYTREFKLQALRMMTDQGLSVAEVARRLGVTEGSLRAWREEARGRGAAASPVMPRRPRRTTSSAACGPRTRGSRPSGTC
jgi:transposase-like protein